MEFSKLSKQQLLGLGKVALYLVASSLISYLITFLAGNPEFFGALTPVVNIALVAIRDFFKKDEE